MKLKQSTIAKELGVTEGRISQLKKQGMPVNSLEAARVWYAQNVDQTFSPKLVPGVALPSVALLPEMIEGAYDIQAARAKREHHEANMAELRERQLLGELVEAERVKRAVSSLAAMVRSAFERIPDKLADRLAANTDAQACHALLTTEIDLVLADLANGAANLKLVADDGRA